MGCVRPAAPFSLTLAKIEAADQEATAALLRSFGFGVAGGTPSDDAAPDLMPEHGVALDPDVFQRQGLDEISFHIKVIGAMHTAGMPERYIAAWRDALNILCNEKKPRTRWRRLSDYEQQQALLSAQCKLDATHAKRQSGAPYDAAGCTLQCASLAGQHVSPCVSWAESALPSPVGLLTVGGEHPTEENRRAPRDAYRLYDYELQQARRRTQCEMDVKHARRLALADCPLRFTVTFHDAALGLILRDDPPRVAVVWCVVPNSSADAAGVPVGVSIQAVNGRLTHNLDSHAVRAALGAAARPVSVLFTSVNAVVPPEIDMLRELGTCGGKAALKPSRKAAAPRGSARCTADEIPGLHDLDAAANDAWRDALAADDATGDAWYDELAAGDVSPSNELLQTRVPALRSELGNLCRSQPSEPHYSPSPPPPRRRQNRGPSPTHDVWRTVHAGSPRTRPATPHLDTDLDAAVRASTAQIPLERARLECAQREAEQFSQALADSLTSTDDALAAEEAQQLADALDLSLADVDPDLARELSRAQRLLDQVSATGLAAADHLAVDTMATQERSLIRDLSVSSSASNPQGLPPTLGQPLRIKKGDAIHAIYVGCVHGWVLVEGDVEASARPLCPSWDCIHAVTQWYHASHVPPLGSQAPTLPAAILPPLSSSSGGAPTPIRPRHGEEPPSPAPVIHAMQWASAREATPCGCPGHGLDAGKGSICLNDAADENGLCTDCSQCTTCHEPSASNNAHACSCACPHCWTLLCDDVDDNVDDSPGDEPPPADNPPPPFGARPAGGRGGRGGKGGRGGRGDGGGRGDRASDTERSPLISLPYTQTLQFYAARWRTLLRQLSTATSAHDPLAASIVSGTRNELVEVAAALVASNPRPDRPPSMAGLTYHPNDTVRRSTELAGYRLRLAQGAPPIALCLEAAAAEWHSFTWPLSSISDVLRLLSTTWLAPRDVVGFEFSGAVRTAIERQGDLALSVDLRNCPLHGMHATLDVRMILPLQRWRRAFLFPPCYQQLRADVDCLRRKIDDGRAFWGCATVLWCTTVDADLVVVEQPDTIFDDHAGLATTSLNTSCYLDTPSKYVRLVLRNCSLPPPPNPRDHHGQRHYPHRSQYRYANADERDRERSSWLPYRNLCSALASLAPLQLPPPERATYATAIEAFAASWHAQGWPVPDGYDHPLAIPPTDDAQRYQLVRGPGDGRRVRTVVPTLARSRCAIPGPVVVHGGGDDPPPTIDCRTATATSVILVFVTTLMTPLVYAHSNGFSVIGAELPSALSRPLALQLAQRWTEAAVGAFHFAYLVGEYVGGARLFAAPISFRPSNSLISHASDARSGHVSRPGFGWMTLAALGASSASDIAARAIAATTAFVRPTSVLADFSGPLAEPTIFRYGAAAATSILRAPIFSDDGGPSGLAALAASSAADDILRNALTFAGAEPFLQEWASIVRPIDADVIPPALFAALPDFTTGDLETLPLSDVSPPLRTAWLPLHPLQPPPPPEAPACVLSPYHMMTPQAQFRVFKWVNATLADLIGIRDGLADGIAPDAVPRQRPRPLAVGQEALLPWARGRVWDCTFATSRCCIVANFHAPITTHLALGYLAQRLRNYYDQELVSHLLEGVRLNADVELQSVFVSHLTSLPRGFKSVQDELRRLQARGWYHFFPYFPYWPMYLNGQGAVARKLESRYRRTTEGGGPRKLTLDESGLRALSINEASYALHMPLHFKRDVRPSMLSWLTARGLPPTGNEERGLPGQPSKWPKEVKPQLTQLMRDVSILRRAAALLGEPIYVFGDDIKDHFNQLAMAPSELHKVGAVTLAHDGERRDLLPPGAPSLAGDQLIFVSERVLGFGMHPASNVAQRASDALLHIFRCDMDDADAHSFTEPGGKMAAWRQTRAAMAARIGTPCKRDVGVCAVSDTHATCDFERLYTAYIFTDDPIFVVVGAQRALRALRVWRQLTTDTGLIMAIPEKRHLGSHATWLGVIIIVSLGIVVVPTAKLLRAAHAIRRTLSSGIEFSDYRSLCGLLEHLRAINLTGRNTMHGLYAPHGPDGAAADGPSAVVRCDPLMRKQLQRWLSLLTRSGGVSVKRALLRDEMEPSPSLYILACSDACLDNGVAGLGGYSHGFYWQFDVPYEDVPHLNIPTLEFIAVAFNILVFRDYFASLLSSGTSILLRTDALTVALTLPHESMRSPLLVSAYQWLRDSDAFQQLQPHLRCSHLYGDANPLSDRLSRGKWSEFYALCGHLQVTPERLPLPPACADLYRTLLQRAMLPDVRNAAKRARAVAPGCAGSASAAASKAMCIGTVGGKAKYRPAHRLAPPRARASVEDRYRHVAAASGLVLLPPYHCMRRALQCRHSPRLLNGPDQPCDPYLRVLPSELGGEGGLGLYAMKAFLPGDRICEMASPRTFPSDDDCRAFLRTRGLPGLACVDQTADEAFTSFGVRRRIAWYMMNHAPDGVANVRLRTVDDGRLCWVACRAITLHEELTWCYGGAGCVPSSWGQKARRVLTQRRGRPSPPASIRRELLGDVAATHCLRALHLGSCGGDPAEDVNTMLVRSFRSARSSAAPAMPPPPPPSLLGSPADRRPPPLPPPPPSRAAVSASASSLQAASAYYAKARAAALAHGGGSMALRADLATILDVGERLDEYATFGVNAGTAKKDARAWSMWVSVCRRLGTEPLRTAEEARTRPERNAYLLACLMLHAFAIGKPRDAAREFIKPRSALAYPLAIMRVFKRWGIQMPSYQMLVAELQGLSRLYVQYHGPHSMAPRRAEPMKFSMVASINAVTDVQVGRWWWSDRDHLVFTFRRLNLVLMRTAFRLGEVSSHASGEVMYTSPSPASPG